MLVNSPPRQLAVDDMCLVIAIDDIFNSSVEDLYNTRPHFWIRIHRILSQKSEYFSAINGSQPSLF